jgi:hypothetical protein
VLGRRRAIARGTQRAVEEISIDTFARGGSDMRGFVSSALLSSIAVAVAGCAIDTDPGEASLALVGAEEPTQPGSSADIRRDDCVPKWGIDWNLVLGVDDADIVSPFCTEVHVSDRYVPEALWITNTADGIEGGPVVYPDGYEPALKAPMDDFLHKLARVRYVVRPSGQEFTFPASEIENLLTVDDLFRGSDEFTPPQLVWPAVALLGELPRLLVPGSYRAEIHFLMSDTHCDGQTTDFAKSCLPPGDSFVLARDFTVVP